ncbi:uncharacterized protein LOC128887094 [Hylaeus anthracinus]|uniref:uncharacterized protein LOC128887094 n=1 Tax=Hylaeus anthracinus TaxID=313031 RepID=UPI0023B926F2|nr:uncharacterized protein LOC128887094 [Hylaeus anthracinus]
MDVMHWNLEQRCLESTLSLKDLRAKLFPGNDRKFDRAAVISENKYTPKTLEGYWFERRAVYIPEYVEWKSIYDTDYKAHINKSWKENQIAKWDNKLELEGMSREKLLGLKKQYYSNMTTTYDLSYNILPKGLKGPRNRSYHARQRKWIPELDLTKSYGNLTQFGLKDAMEEEIYKNSEDGIAECRWQTTYREEIGQLTPVNVERNTRFNRRIVDFNVPDLKHFEQKSSDIERCLLSFKATNSKSIVK